MKFKKLKGEAIRSIVITDFSGDTLKVETAYSEDNSLWFQTNEGSNVQIKRDKALKLAWAIIEELDTLA
jgi:hypothetical protein